MEALTKWMACPDYLELNRDIARVVADLRKPETRVAAAVKIAIGTMFDPDFGFRLQMHVDELQSFTSDADPMVREHLLMAQTGLRPRPGPGAMHAAIPLLDDPRMNVRRAAMHVLRRSASSSPEVRDAVIRVLTEEPPRGAAAYVGVQLIRDLVRHQITVVHTDRRIVPALIVAMERHPSPGFLEVTASTLGEMCAWAEESLPALREIVEKATDEWLVERVEKAIEAIEAAAPQGTD